MKQCSLGLGCWGLGGDAYGELSEETSKRIINNAKDSGITFFDTSPSYGFGLSESRLGRYLGSDTRTLVATKVGLQAHSGTIMPFDLSENAMRDSIQSSMKRLQTDSISLVQVHSPPLDVLQLFPDLLKALDRITRDGLVQNWGISLQKPSHLNFFSKLYPWKSFQMNYSLLDQRILQECDENTLKDLNIIARTPLNFGFLTENFQYSQLAGNKLSHLSKWSKEQITSWHLAAGKMHEIARQWEMKIQHLALRFVIDSSVANIVIPGAISESELKDNLLSIKNSRLSEWQILKLKETYLEIERDLTIKSPFKYSLGKA